MPRRKTALLIRIAGISSSNSNFQNRQQNAIPRSTQVHLRGRPENPKRMSGQRPMGYVVCPHAQDCSSGGNFIDRWTL
ncbi:hypothetical protein BDV18DRAFT_78974 [Aspergillus unguis]